MAFEQPLFDATHERRRMRKCSADRSSLARKAAVGSLALVAGAVLLHGGCLVTEYCYSSADCVSPQICLQNGSCGFECSRDTDCGEGMGCEDHRCRPKSAQPIECPADMVNIAEAFCIDRFEASRPDATSTSEGTQEDRAVSRSGVLPWQLFAPDNNATARAACLAAGKDLCTSQQWRSACEGRAGTVYGYGNTYEPETCNGIDTFGLSGFHLLPTGSQPRCRSDWGVYDINGNLWEHTLHGDNRTIRGGAYNCKDSQTLHRCDYIPGDWEPTARGFRCCLVPSGIPDAGIPDADEPEVRPDVQSETEVGCLDPDVSFDVLQDVSPDISPDVPPDVTPDVSDAPEPDGDSDAEAGTDGCPSDMVRIKTSTRDFCMDVYEASRIDATAYTLGTIPVASSRPGVQPWQPIDLPGARNACTSAGKRLCGLDEWVQGCSGPSGMAYGYGNTYDPVICNGIDTYCDCDGAACGSLSTCPYPNCFNQASSEGGGPCGAALRLEVTGAFPSCLSPYGVYDINGNVWELVDTNDGLEHFRGGAFNCMNSEALHRCDHDGTWGPTARGFRCCKDPE